MAWVSGVWPAMKAGESSSPHTNPCAVVDSVPSAVNDQRTITAHPPARARNHFSIETNLRSSRNVGKFTPGGRLDGDETERELESTRDLPARGARWPTHRSLDTGCRHAFGTKPDGP